MRCKTVRGSPAQIGDKAGNSIQVGIGIAWVSAHAEHRAGGTADRAASRAGTDERDALGI